MLESCTTVIGNRDNEDDVEDVEQTLSWDIGLMQRGGAVAEATEYEHTVYEIFVKTRFPAMGMQRLLYFWLSLIPL